MDYRNIREDAQPLLSPEFLKQREQQKEDLKELLNDTIKQDIGENLGFLDLDTLATAAKIITSIEDVYNLYKKYFTTKENLEQLLEPVNDTLESAIFNNEKSLALGHLAKFYPQLYVRIAFMFIEPVTKSYIKPKIESNCITCLAYYLVIKYFSELNSYITKTKNIRESTKEKFTQKVSKILDKITTEMNKNFPGIYEYIDTYYEKKIDTNVNINL
jgi:hypothetical protein